MRIIVATIIAIALTPSVVSAQSATETTLYSFPSGTVSASLQPSGLIQAEDGNFYGTTSSGGSFGFGTIYRLTPSGSFSTPYSFTGIDDGALPTAGVIQASDGLLYGTASRGGANAGGTIFRFSSSGALLTSVYAFRDESDGNNPATNFVQGSNGAFFGTDYSSDLDGYLYTINLSGQFTTLAALDTSVTSPLLQASDGNFCAFAEFIGVVKITPSGSISTFAGTGESTTVTGVVEGSTGMFYAGTGNSPYSIIQITPTGAISTLYTFGTSTVLEYPLLLASDGNLYGASTYGGVNGDGEIFRLTPSGTFTSLYSFTNGGDGENPSSSLLEGSDGNLYGTASGGSGGGGVIYKLALSPALSSPVALSLSSSSVNAYTPVMLSWVVPNAASDTLQQCYAFVQGSPVGAGTWTGKQVGAFSDGVYFGSSSITPTAAGTYTYALTCGGVESGFATLTVNAADRVNTTTSLAASPNPATVGQYVTLSSKVAPTSGSGIPTGTVSFYYAGKVLTSATLNGSGVASYVASTTGLPAGSYSITAKYGGDANNSPSSSTALVVVLKAAAEAALTASPSVVTQDSSTTLSAQVSSATGIPSGKVTFYYGGQALGTGTLNPSGIANFTATASVPNGKYAVTAIYAGDATHGTATSQPVTITVQ